MLGKYFELDRKIGLAHILSIIALLVSAWSLWLSHERSKPHIIVSKDTSVGGAFFDDTKARWRLFGYERLVIANVGGKPVTLIGLRPPQGMPIPGMVTAIIKDGKAQEITSEVLLVEELFEDLRHNASALSKHHGWPLEKLGTLNRFIPAGATTTLNLVVIYEAYDGEKPKADFIVTQFDVVFSDGTTYPYKVAAEVVPAQ